MVARGAGAAGPVLLACRQWDPLWLARRLPSLGVGAWRSAPLLPWRVQCPIRVCAALADGSGGSGRYVVLCLSRFPLPGPRVPRCVWRAVPLGCPLPSPAGTPFHAVCAFRELGPVTLLVVPACPLRVCALALPRRPLPPPLDGVACALPRSRHWALVGPLHVVRTPSRVLPRSLAPSGVLGGGRSGPSSPLLGLGLWGWRKGVPGGGAFHHCEGRLRSGAVPPPTARPLGGPLWSATHVLWARACGCGGPTLSPWPARPVGAACRGGGGAPSPYQAWGCAPPVGRVRGVRVPRGGLGGGAVRAPCPPFVQLGEACRAGGRSASFRPSAFPGQATKRVSLASFWSWGAWPPISIRFLLARLHWARYVRPPGALARARLFPAVPVGAGGWGGGAGRAPAPLSGGGRGDNPPCLGGWGRGPRGLRADGGVWGGGVAPRPLCSPSGWRPAVPYPGPPLVVGALPPGARVRSGSRGRPGGGRG